MQSIGRRFGVHDVSEPKPGAGELVDLLTVRRTTTPRPIPADERLGFGRYFTDHVFRVDYSAKAWHRPRIEPYGALDLEPAAAVLHYAQAVFEGIKVFRGDDGTLYSFRLLDHCQRFATSARGLGMPPLGPRELAGVIRRLVRLDSAWVPADLGSALYIRPIMLAVEPCLSVRPAERYACVVVLSPVGTYYEGDPAAIRLWVETRRARVAPGGIGSIKASANYSGSLTVTHEAQQRGFDQVLWLDGHEHRYIEEAGTMNVFIRLREQVITPPIDGSILPGITRDSVLTLLRSWGVPLAERRLSIDELRDAHKRGDVCEVFGTGTAALIAPVRELGLADSVLVIGDGQPGSLARRLHDTLTRIQHGMAPEPFGWVDIVP